MDMKKQSDNFQLSMSFDLEIPENVADSAVTVAGWTVTLVAILAALALVYWPL